MYGTSTPSAPRSRACCIPGRSLYPPTRTIDLAPPLAIAANIADNFSYPIGPCCVSTSSQSYPLCANCSATVGLCEFKNNPSFGLPSRSSFLNSAPVTTSAIINSPYLALRPQILYKCNLQESPQFNSAYDRDAAARTDRFYGRRILEPVFNPEFSTSPGNQNLRWATAANLPIPFDEPRLHPQTTTANKANPWPEFSALHCTALSASLDPSPRGSGPSACPCAHFGSAHDSPHPAETASTKTKIQKRPDCYLLPPSETD